MDSDTKKLLLLSFGEGRGRWRGRGRGRVERRTRHSVRRGRSEEAWNQQFGPQEYFMPSPPPVSYYQPPMSGSYYQPPMSGSYYQPPMSGSYHQPPMANNYQPPIPENNFYPVQSGYYPPVPAHGNYYPQAPVGYPTSYQPPPVNFHYRRPQSAQIPSEREPQARNNSESEVPNTETGTPVEAFKDLKIA